MSLQIIDGRFFTENNNSSRDRTVAGRTEVVDLAPPRLLLVLNPIKAKHLHVLVRKINAERGER